MLSTYSAGAIAVYKHCVLLRYPCRDSRVILGSFAVIDTKREVKYQTAKVNVKKACRIEVVSGVTEFT
jgi:hypothetical protein